MMVSGGKRRLALLAATWLFAVGTGLLLMTDYASKPGSAADPPHQWPAEALLYRKSDRPALLMFLHPFCPCSKASLSELARLANGEPDRFDLIVVLVQPAGMEVDRSRTDLWKAAESNTNLQVVIDRDALLTDLFGVRTSGQVLVYDEQGNLRFNGGITPGRGHAGDSPGRSIVLAIAESEVPKQPARCPAFGCSLSADSFFDPASGLR